MMTFSISIVSAMRIHTPNVGLIPPPPHVARSISVRSGSLRNNSLEERAPEFVSPRKYFTPAACDAAASDWYWLVYETVPLQFRT